MLVKPNPHEKKKQHIYCPSFLGGFEGFCFQPLSKPMKNPAIFFLDISSLDGEVLPSAAA